MIYKNAELYNIEEMERIEEPSGYLLNRIPGALRAKLNEKAQKTAFDGCGCEIRFNIDGESVKVVLARMPDDNKIRKGIAEIYHGSFQASYQESPRIIGSQLVTIEVHKPDKLSLLEKLTHERNLPFDPNLTRIILPYDWRYCLLDIQGACSPPKPEQTPKRRLLSYGSSITHGGTAVRPTGTYAMRLARLLKTDLINLGFAGSALLDEELATYIAGRKDWDLATIELGINVVHSWSVAEFKRKVDYFISTIAEQNQDKWIFCIDMFTFSMDFTNNPKAADFRVVVKEKVQSLNLPKLVYISGQDLLTQVTGLSADLLHPAEDGMEEIANNLYKKIISYQGNEAIS